MIVQHLKAPKLSGWLILEDDGAVRSFLRGSSNLDELAPNMRDLDSSGRWKALPTIRVSARELERLEAMAKRARR
ncbi:MAG: hypothetical protein HYV07_09660 [Deltaproteobacteria bacterium]|nr:hypothetical protein [Deltaproteobacteria bacterium]